MKRYSVFSMSFVIFSEGQFESGLRSRSRDRSWSRSESIVLPGVGVGSGVEKIGRLRLLSGVAGYQPSTDNNFRRMVNILRKTLKIRKKGEWRCRDKVEG